MTDKILIKRAVVEQVLDALESNEINSAAFWVEIAALRAALEQPDEQEPAAYRHLHEDGWEYYDTPTGSDCKGCQALYTHPQSHHLLTDEQILHCIDMCIGGPSPSYQLDSSDWINFARAIEQSHGIK